MLFEHFFRTVGVLIDETRIYSKPCTGVGREVYNYSKGEMMNKMLTLEPGLMSSYTYTSRGFMNELSCLRGNDSIFADELESDVDGQITAQHYNQRISSSNTQL